jgi:hypothetical protein
MGTDLEGGEQIAGLKVWTEGQYLRRGGDVGGGGSRSDVFLWFGVEGFGL